MNTPESSSTQPVSEQATATKPARTDFYAAHAARQPDKPALICEDRVMTYAQLNARINRLANALRGLGVRAGDRVSSMLYNSTEGFEIAGALNKLGAINVQLNYRLREREVAYIIKDSQSKLVIAGPGLVQVVEQARPQLKEQIVCIAIGDEVPEGWQRYEELVTTASEEAPPSDPSALGSSMIYTSGTTGNPKGAYRPNGVSLDAVVPIIQIYGLSPNDVHLMVGPGYHSAPNFFVTVQLLLGATLVIQPHFDAALALRQIERYRVTTSFMAPTLLQRLCDAYDEADPKPDTSSLHAVIIGGAPFPYALKVRAVERFGNCIWEFYGATETGFVTILRPEDQLRKPGSCGQAGPNQEILLLDAAGNPVPDGVPGEIWVRNAGLAQYYNKPEATAKNMRDGFFTVGDIAYRDSEGYYFICDRKIDMIISGGVNIYPAEIEAVLFAHPAVADAAVIGVPDEYWGESVKAVVQLRPGADVSAEELIAFCAERLADYKRPRSIDFVDELPRSPSGKLLKNRIREPYWAGVGRKI